MQAQLESLAHSRSDVKVRKIDVVSWDSPVSEQHSIRSLPHLVLYDGRKKVATGTRDVAARLNRL